MQKTHSEMFYQIIALLLSLIVVHAIFVTLVRPNAEAIIQQHEEQASAGEDYQVPRSFFVVIKDFEQEACFILMFWALAIMIYKGRTTLRERQLLDAQLVNIPQGTLVLPDDSQQLSRPIESLSEDDAQKLLPRALLTALTRFQVTRNVQSANDAVTTVCEMESSKLESELSMIRYITWAIPSIGFIGTVRGIGSALGQAHEAMRGDIAGVTSSLGVAFNSTFVALLISIVIMFFMHQLQVLQERSVLDTHDYCDRKLLRFFRSE